MAYDKNKIFEQAKSEIQKRKLFFIEDIVAFLPCSKPTFYELFPLESNELNELKTMLDNNKIEIKTSMRQKWYKSDNPTLQMALMKLICSDEERIKLSINYNTNTNTNIEVPVFKEIDLDTE